MTVPDEAVEAALEALSSRTATGADSDRLSRDAAKLTAVVAIEAAAPFIARAERERIRTLADEKAAKLRAAGREAEAEELSRFADSLGDLELKGES